MFRHITLFCNARWSTFWTRWFLRWLFMDWTIYILSLKRQWFKDFLRLLTFIWILLFSYHRAIIGALAWSWSTPLTLDIFHLNTWFDAVICLQVVFHIVFNVFCTFKEGVKSFLRLLLTVLQVWPLAFHLTWDWLFSKSVLLLCIFDRVHLFCEFDCFACLEFFDESIVLTASS